MSISYIFAVTVLSLEIYLNRLKVFFKKLIISVMSICKH